MAILIDAARQIWPAGAAPGAVPTTGTVGVASWKARDADTLEATIVLATGTSSGSLTGLTLSLEASRDGILWNRIYRETTVHADGSADQAPDSGEFDDLTPPTRVSARMRILPGHLHRLTLGGTATGLVATVLGTTYKGE